MIPSPRMNIQAAARVCLIGVLVSAMPRGKKARANKPYPMY